MLAQHIRNGLVILLTVVVSGCGSATETRATATLAGAITIDGNPLPEDAEGTIQFMPQASGQAPPTSAPVISGKYRAEKVPMGAVKVIFNITRLTGRMVTEPGAPGGDKYAQRENLVPAKTRAGIDLEVTTDNLEQNIDLAGK